LGSHIGRVSETSIFFGSVVLAPTVLGACYVLVAWHVGRRWGSQRLLAVWLACSCLSAIAGVYRLHQQYGLSGNVLPLPTDLRLLVFALIFALCGFGLATLSVRKRLRRAPTGVPTVGGVAAGVGSFFAGLGLGLLPLLVLDIRRVSGP
jgi:hypothetical protein